MKLRIENNGNGDIHINGVTVKPGGQYWCDGERAEMLLGVEPRVATEKTLVALFAHIERVRDNWVEQTGDYMPGDHYCYERNEDAIHFIGEWNSTEGGAIPLRAFYDFDGAVAEDARERAEAKARLAEHLREKDLADLRRLAEAHNFKLVPIE